MEVLGLLGGTGYRAVVADYDGDGKADPAVYGEATGDWKVMLSGAGYGTVTLADFLGGAGYIPVPADYDGDGQANPVGQERERQRMDRDVFNGWLHARAADDFV